MLGPDVLNPGRVAYIPDTQPNCSVPALCPKCRREENKKTVCSWCGYEYSENEPSARFWIVSTSTLSFIIYLVITVGHFIIFSDEYETLGDLLKAQLEFIKRLRVW